MFRIAVQVALRGLQDLLSRLQTLFDDGVGTFADDQDLAFGGAHDHSHALPVRVEFDQVEQLILLHTVPGLANHVVVLVALFEEKAAVASAVDQSKLIWTGGIISNVFGTKLGFFDVSYHSVAQTECLMEALQVSIVLMIRVLDLLRKRCVLKIDVCDTFWIVEGRRVITTILKASGGETLEFHDVLGESARFVAEDVVNHAELLIEI